MLGLLWMTAALGGKAVGPLLVAGALLTGCAGEEGTPLPKWKLVTDDGKSVDVTLPAHVAELVPHSCRSTVNLAEVLGRSHVMAAP